MMAASSRTEVSLPVVLSYLTCALVWGTTWFAIRVCTIGDGAYPVYYSIALRFSLATLLLVPVYLIGRVKHPGAWGPRDRAQWGWLIFAGLLDALGYTLVYLGEQEVPGALAAVLYGTQPLIMALILTATGTERVARTDLIGAVVSIIGITLILLERIQVSTDQAAGILMVLGSVLVASSYSWIMKHRTHDVHPMASTTVFLGVTAVGLWIWIGLRGLAGRSEVLVWPPHLEPTLALLYLGIFGSVIAFASYFWLLRKISMMASGTLVFVMPLIALVVDAIWESVRLSWQTYIGVAVTLSGLAISLWFRRRPEEESCVAATP
jgi:drug/metabolite transporter (DMT)-like permease